LPDIQPKRYLEGSRRGHWNSGNSPKVMNIPVDAIDVSLSIVNWNTADLTSQLIESVYEHVQKLTIEIIVVDNASSDGSADYIENHYPNVVVIRNTTNYGYGKAHNQALRISIGRYHLILNSDVLFIDNSLEIIVDFMDRNRDVSAVGPLCLDEKGNIGYSYGFFPRPGRMILDKLFGSVTPGFIKPPPLRVKPDQMTADKEIEVEYISGACLLIRRGVCDEVGFFDETFFAYYEETDWCFRMNKRGLKRCLIPQTKIIHYGNASFGRMPERAIRYFEESKRKYLKKHYGSSVAKIYSLTSAWADIRHKIKKHIKNANPFLV
jgi:hypothetical protein